MTGEIANHIICTSCITPESARFCHCETIGEPGMGHEGETYEANEEIEPGKICVSPPQKSTHCLRVKAKVKAKVFPGPMHGQRSSVQGDLRKARAWGRENDRPGTICPDVGWNTLPGLQPSQRNSARTLPFLGLYPGLSQSASVHAPMLDYAAKTDRSLTLVLKRWRLAE